MILCDDYREEIETTIEVVAENPKDHRIVQATMKHRISDG